MAVPMRHRVYLDTSVIGGCEDAQFAEWSLQLFEEFKNGLKIAVVSDLTRLELEGAPRKVQDRLSSLPAESVEDVSLTEEAETLASRYITEGVVGASHVADAQHIAIASVERVHVLVSWNFKQIVNVGRIHGYNAVNLKSGYPMLEIRSPREVLDEDEEPI